MSTWGLGGEGRRHAESETRVLSPASPSGLRKMGTQNRVVYPFIVGWCSVSPFFGPIRFGRRGAPAGATRSKTTDDRLARSLPPLWAEVVVREARGMGRSDR